MKNPTQDRGPGPFQTVLVVALLACVTSGIECHVLASRNGTSLSINFGASDPNTATSSLGPSEVAGVVASANWNNTSGASGSLSSLVVDQSGGRGTSSARVLWSSPNTWRSGANNQFPAGPNRKMLSGYLDSGNTAATGVSITVTNLPDSFVENGYDVYVYFLRDAGNSGGAYTLSHETGTVRKYGSTVVNGATFVEDPGGDSNNTQDGTYLRFRNLSGSWFRLRTDTTLTTPNGFRAPVNGIQVVQLGQGVPLGTAEYHSAGIFKVEQFLQSSPDASPTLTGAHFDGYAFTQADMTGLTGGSIDGFPLTSIELQTIDPLNDVERRRFYLGSSPFQFPQPPPTDFSSRQQMDLIWANRDYGIALNKGHFIDPLTFVEEPAGAVVLGLSGDAYPAAPPRLSNLATLRSWSGNGPFVLEWEPFAGASGADFIEVQVQWEFNGMISRTASAPAGEPGALKGTAIQYVVPGENTPPSATRARVVVTFFKVTAVVTDQYPGCVGLAGYARQTAVPIEFGAVVQPEVSVSDRSIPEGTGVPGAIPVEVRLSVVSSRTVTVQYSTVGGSALAGDDFEAVAGEITFAPGETVKTVSVPIVADAVFEPDESFEFRLSAPVNASLGRVQAVLSIVNDDIAAPPSLAAAVNANGTLDLEWATSPDVVLEYRRDLSAAGQWTRLTEGIVEAGGKSRLSPAQDSTTGFFRLTTR